MTQSFSQVEYGTSTLHFRILRKPTRKTAEIKVHPDMSLTVTVPNGTRTAEVNRIVRRKAEWIVKKQWRISKYRKHVSRQFISGESYFYLGRQYQLKVKYQRGRNAEPDLQFFQGRFVLSIPLQWSREQKMLARETLLEEWYRERAKQNLPPLVRRFEKRVGLKASRLIVTEMKKRWGSCGTDGTVRLNWKIVLAPVSLIEYVVAHEVCHLRYANHSQHFWRILERVLPDYRLRREMLERNGARFSL